MTADPQSTHRDVRYDVLLVLITVAAFSPVFVAQFSMVLDDFGTITLNQRINPPSWSGVGHYWRHSEYGLYAPVTYTVWSLLSWLGHRADDPAGVGLYPVVFHAANLLFHLVSVLAVRRILQLLVKSPTAATFGALLFAIHPIQVEAVAWASGTKDVLAGMFGLLAIWFYLRRKTMTHYVVATVFLALAMLSKSSAMTIPAIAILLDIFVLRRSRDDVIRAIVPWLAMSVVCMIVARGAQPASDVPAAPIWARPLIVGDSIDFYLKKIAFPLELCIDYGHTPAEAMSRPWFYVNWIVPTALFVLAYRRRKTQLLWLTGFLVFVIAPAPVLGFVTFLFQRFSTVADHYLYVAMLGPAIVIAALLDQGWSKRVWITSGVVAAALFVLTIRQATFWRNDGSLFDHSIDVTDRGVLALNNEGVLWERIGQYDQAAAYFRRAVEVNPSYVTSQENLDDALRMLKQTQPASQPATARP